MSFQPRHPLFDQNLFASETLPRRRLRHRLTQALAVWRERAWARRCLAHLDTRRLREMGISPAAAAFESGRPFWRRIGPLR